MKWHEVYSHRYANKIVVNLIIAYFAQFVNDMQIMNLRMGLLEAVHRNEEMSEVLAQKEQQLEQQDKTSRAQARVIKVTLPSLLTPHYSCQIEGRLMGVDQTTKLNR